MPEVSRLRVVVAVADPCCRAHLCRLVRDTPEFDLAGVAMDADEAAALLASQRPGVVVLDAKMPCGGAPRALRAVSLVSPAPRILILFSSADSRLLIPFPEAVVEHLPREAATTKEMARAIARAGRHGATDLLRDKVG
jgi:DNA-binding NarL/FixJ family response regulator